MGTSLLVRSPEIVCLIDKVADFVNLRNTNVSSVHVHYRQSLARGATIPLVYTLLAVVQVIIAGIVIFLILLHSGKDAGLSGAFGIGGGGSSFGGGSMVERNLDRATVFFSVLFVVNTLVLLKI
jgi:preprotein translocase subunit SecG